MTKVLTFSRKFPSNHPKKGQPTFFVNKICSTLMFDYEFNEEFIKMDIDHAVTERPIKVHTIRKGHRFKQGDLFSARFWSDKPYFSKQVTFIDKIKVVKTYDFSFNGEEFFLNNQPISPIELHSIAYNDGLTSSEFKQWFNKPFTGQVICWIDPEYPINQKH